VVVSLWGALTLHTSYLVRSRTQLIINRPAVFEPYSHAWWMPLSRLILASDQYGGGLNYFVQDLCGLLLAWATPVQQPPAAVSDTDAAAGSASGSSSVASATPPFRSPGPAGTPTPVEVAAPPVWPPLRPRRQDAEQRGLASDLVAFLMRHATSRSKPVLRYNLDLIKGLCEQWADLLTIRTSVLADQLSRNDGNGEVDKADNLVGVQLLAVALANGLWPYGRALPWHATAVSQQLECCR